MVLGKKIKLQDITVEEEEEEEERLEKVCCLGSYPTCVLPSTNTCITFFTSRLKPSFKIPQYRKKNTWSHLNWEKKKKKKTGKLNSWVKFFLVNLLYTTIYTVCIYSINIPTHCLKHVRCLKNHPSFLNSCKNDIKHRRIYSVNPQWHGACITGFTSKLQLGEKSLKNSL